MENRLNYFPRFNIRFKKIEFLKFIPTLYYGVLFFCLLFLGAFFELRGELVYIRRGSTIDQSSFCRGLLA